MTIRDTVERLFWTVAAVMGGALTAGPLVGISVWQGAVLLGVSAGINFLTIVARARLAVLPNPGDGLPGLPTDDHGQVTLLEVFLIVVLSLIFLRVFAVI